LPSLGLGREIAHSPAVRSTPARLGKAERVAIDYLCSTAAIAAGDEEELARLYDRTSRLVYSLALRILRRPEDAEEVVLDVYAQAWRSAGTFDASRGPVEAWLLMMTRTRAIDRLRARRARPDLDAVTLVELENHGTREDAERIVSAFDGHRVRAVLQRLPPSDRRLVELAFFEGYTHRELAALLQLPLGTVKTRLRNSLLSLRRVLSSNLEIRRTA